MQIAGKTRAAEQAGIKQRSMIEAIFQHRIALPDQRGDRAEVGHVAIGEQQRAGPPGELGEGFFEGVMGRAVADHQMRSTTADAPALGAGLPGRDDFGVIGQPHVIVVAERQQLLAVDNDFRALRALQQGPLTVKVLGTTGSETCVQIKGHAGLESSH